MVRDYIHIWTDTIVHDCGESSCDGGLIVGCVHTIVPLGHLIACGKYFVVSMACSMQHLVSSLSSAQLDGLPLCHPAPELMPRLDGMHLNADTAEPLARAQLTQVDVRRHLLEAAPQRGPSARRAPSAPGAQCGREE